MDFTREGNAQSLNKAHEPKGYTSFKDDMIFTPAQLGQHIDRQKCMRRRTGSTVEMVPKKHVSLFFHGTENLTSQPLDKISSSRNEEPSEVKMTFTPRETNNQVEHKLIYQSHKPLKRSEIEILCPTPTNLAILSAILWLCVLVRDPTIITRRAYCCGRDGAFEVNGHVVCANPSQSTCTDFDLARPYKWSDCVFTFFGTVLGLVLIWGGFVFGFWVDRKLDPCRQKLRKALNLYLQKVREAVD